MMNTYNRGVEMGMEGYDRQSDVRNRHYGL
jgi:hypothetical protein